jgi:NADH-quinone oxidoreductase subunit J
MIITPFLQWLAFGIFSLIAIAGAVGMTTTMSMFRSGILLVAGFFGVSGLFILLSADLLSFLLVMMYIGGMLIMILFMVLFSEDPGGDMMSKMPGLSFMEKLFSIGIGSKMENGKKKMETSGHAMPAINHMAHNHAINGQVRETEKRAAIYTCPMHPEFTKHEPGQCPLCSMSLIPKQTESHTEHTIGDINHENHTDPGMKMDAMTMTTPIKRVAVFLSAGIALVFVILLWVNLPWKLSFATPNPNSAEMIGFLLLGKYMIVFEGAGLLILVTAFSSVWIARSDYQFTDKQMQEQAAIDTPPRPITGELLRTAPVAVANMDKNVPTSKAAHEHHTMKMGGDI